MDRTYVLGMPTSNIDLAKTKLVCASRERIQQMKCDAEIHIAKIEAKRDVKVAKIGAQAQVRKVLIWAIASVLGGSTILAYVPWHKLRDWLMALFSG